jgi:hypothetical protein
MIHDFFSAIFAVSAVNEKTKPIIGYIDVNAYNAIAYSY